MPVRAPIIVVLGHVDHGKTSILDAIRGTTVAMKEAGGITQHIGATEVPIDVIKKISGKLMDKFRFQFKIPGILFIDTPGHAAFTNLRKRGGSVADLAVIVIDIMEGLMPQTYESIEICKQFKVPFIVAANKIDRIPGWKNSGSFSFLEAIKKQDQKTISILEEKLYNIVGQLYELGFESERFDRVSDFTRQVAIVPTSAKTKEGLAELLLLVAGIAQKFLEKKLKIDVSGPGKGVILEKKEVKGMGHVIDVIIYDGVVKKGDRFIVMGINGPIVSKVKGLFRPLPLKEIREKGTKFVEVDKVYASAGIRILGPNLEEALAGSPFYVIQKEEDINSLTEKLQKEISEFLFESDKIGLIVKADTLGSLEAIVKILKDKGYPIRKAGIGKITKKDIILANASKEIDIKYGCVLGFNVSIDEDAKVYANNFKIKIILDNVIYSLIDKLEEWFKEAELIKKRKVLENLVYPFKIKILPGFVFRRSNPAIVGVEVLLGKVTPGTAVMREDGAIVGKIKSIQVEGKSISEANRGMKVAVAIEGAIVGRHIEEGDILYSYIPEEHYKKYKDYKGLLTDEEKQILKEIARIMRKKNPTWGI